MKFAKIFLLIVLVAGCGVGDRYQIIRKQEITNKLAAKYTMDTNTYFLFGNNWTVEELWGIAPSMMMLRESLIKQQHETQQVALGTRTADQHKLDSVRLSDVQVFLGNFIFDYEDYICEEGEIKQLHKEFERLAKKGRNIKVVMIGGNWCSDTKAGIPAVCRVLDEAGFPGNIDYYRVDREKKFIGDSVAMAVSRVPHIVFEVSKKGDDQTFVPAGEIIEVPNGSWEKNILGIFKKL